MEINRDQIGNILEIIFDKPDMMGMYVLTGSNALMLIKIIKELIEENERLSKYTITCQTPSGEQTMPNLLSLDGDAATLYKKIEDKIKADTVREMQERVYEFADGLDALSEWQINNMIDQIAKEMLEVTDGRT